MRTERMARGSARGAGVALAALAGVLVVGGVIVVKSALSGDSGGSAGGPARAEAATPIEIRERSERRVASLVTARKHLQTGEYDRALAVLERAVEANASDLDLRLAYAEAWMGKQEWANSYEQLEKAIALGPPPPGDPQLHFQAGTVASKAGRLDRALEHYSMAQQGNPIEPKYPLYLAMVQLKVEPPQTDAAAASLLRAIRLNPDLAEAYGTLGQIYLEQNKLGIALQNIQRATALQPNVARWRLVEAKVLKRQGHGERAATVLQGLDADQRRAPEVMRTLGECYGMMKRPELAAAMYAEAFAASAKKSAADAGLAYEAALWFERAGDTTKAREHAAAAAGLGHADAGAVVERISKAAAQQDGK